VALTTKIEVDITGQDVRIDKARRKRTGSVGWVLRFSVGHTQFVLVAEERQLWEFKAALNDVDYLATVIKNRQEREMHQDARP